MSIHKLYEDESEYYAAIDQVKNAFFEIKGNYQIEALGELQTECENFLIHNESEEIEDLISIIVANISYFKTKEKDQAREVTAKVWKKLSTKYEMSFYEIRILNSILFVAKSPKEMFETTQNCLEQLLRYRHTDFYIRIRVSMLFNLIHAFVDYKFSLKDNKFVTEKNLDYVTIINEASNELLELNAKNELKYNVYVAMAMVYTAIANEDKIAFYGSIAFLHICGIHDMMDDTIQFYLNKYNVKF